MFATDRATTRFARRKLRFGATAEAENEEYEEGQEVMMSAHTIRARMRPPARPAKRWPAVLIIIAAALLAVVLGAA